MPPAPLLLRLEDARERFLNLRAQMRARGIEPPPLFVHAARARREEDRPREAVQEPLPPLASPRSRRAATAARAAELRALAAATNSEVAVPVRHAADAPATAAPRPPAQLLMGGPLPTQTRPARIASNPEMVVPGAADTEMEHPVA